MAGSLCHIVSETGEFNMDLIENLGDAHEALDECFNIIYTISGGNRDYINFVLSALDYLTLDIDMKLSEPVGLIK